VDGKAATGKEREALGSIITLLLSLADLAERAAGRSFLVRFLVLSGLRHAHHVARDCFVGPSCVGARRGHEAADAFDLAASFRALALVVRNLAARLLWRSAAASARLNAGVCALGTVYFLPADGRCRFKRGAGGKK